MAFWGIEIKPGKPFSHPPDKGRLHVSQATLGIGSASKKSLVQCNVGDRSPVFLCSLFPEKAESCQLNLEFEEVDEVVFSVVGPRSVHLTGYYQLSGGRGCLNDESESYGEDIADTETENSPNCEENDYEDSFINDDEPEVFPPSPVGSDGNTPEKKKPKKGNRRLRRKFQVSESENDGTPQKQILGTTTHAINNLDPESEDNQPISSLYKVSSVTKGLVKVPEENFDKETCKASTNKTENKESLYLSENTDAVAAVQHKSDGNLELKPQLPPTQVEHVDGAKPRKRKLRVEDKNLTKNVVSTKGLKSDGSTEDLPVNKVQIEMCDNNIGRTFRDDAERCIDGSQSGGKRKKKRKSKDQQNGDAVKLDLPALIIDTEKSISGVQGNSCNDLSTRMATLPNDLVIEDVEMGKEDGKIAVHGKKVYIHYICRSKKTGEVLDSNFGKSPLKIRLGKKEVEGVWYVGLNGMRVGGKRRLVVPPPFRSQLKGAEQNICPDSWLVFDVDLVKVR